MTPMARTQEEKHNSKREKKSFEITPRLNRYRSGLFKSP
jgi:hypothetical protein